MIHDSSEIYIIMYVLGSLSILMRRILNSSFAFFPLHMSTCRNHQQTFVIQNSTFPNWWAAEDITSNLTFAEWIYYTYFVTSMDLTFQKFSSRLKSCKARGGTYFFETPRCLFDRKKSHQKALVLQTAATLLLLTKRRSKVHTVVFFQILSHSVLLKWPNL